MQYELFSDADFQQQTPFAGRAVCLLGTFRLAAKTLQQRLQAIGAEIKQNVSRNVHYAIIGKNPSAEDQERLKRLAYNGFTPRLLNENDLENILQGSYSSYTVPERISKDLHLTLQHYLDSQLNYEGSMNPLYTKELYLSPDTQPQLYQMLGNRGIYANAYIDDTTDAIVISNTSLQHLQQGTTDDSLRYIEQQYNKSRAQAFRYTMTSEGELLAWLNKR